MIVGERSLIEKLTRRGRPDLAEQELRNLLADKDPAGLSTADVGNIAQENGLSAREMRGIATDVYSTALRRFVSDDLITDEESSYLHALRGLLTLSDNELREIEAQVVHPKYSKTLRDVIADGAISPEEKAQLEAFCAALRLDENTEKALRTPVVNEVLTAKLAEIVGDRRVSPFEEKQFADLAKGLLADATIEGTAKQSLELFKLYWQVENGPMPWYEVSIILQKGERCHFVSAADWYEIRTKTVSTGYSGLGYRFRIAKGLYYRVGTFKLAPVRHDELTQIDSGTVYFTNKRIIFDGSKGNKTIRLTALIGTQPYSDGVGLEKATGRSPTLVLGSNSELANIVLSALLAHDPT